MSTVLSPTQRSESLVVMRATKFVTVTDANAVSAQDPLETMTVKVPVDVSGGVMYAEVDCPPGFHT